MQKPNKMPKDLGVKIGSKAEVMWTSVYDTAKNTVEGAEQTLIIQKEVMLMSQRKIKEEQRRAKV